MEDLLLEISSALRMEIFLSSPGAALGVGVGVVVVVEVEVGVGVGVGVGND